MKWVLAIIFAAALLQSSDVPHTVTVLGPGWVDIRWHTSPATNRIQVFRDGRLAQTSPMLSDYTAVWTFGASAGQRVTIVEYADTVEIQRFTTAPIPDEAGFIDPKTYIPLVTRI